MNRIVYIVFSIFFWFLSGINPLCAQSDTTARKVKPAEATRIDSAKNELLTHQSEELQSIQVNRIGDSIRLIQLKKEIIELGAADNSKKQALSNERDVIRRRDSVHYLQLKQKVDSIRSLVTGFPVILGRDTLFYVYAKMGSVPPKERADGLTQRLQNLSKDYFFNEDSLKIVTSDLTTDIMYKEIVIKSVSEMDAIWENTTRDKLAEKYKTKIYEAVKRYRADNSVQSLIRDISMAVVVVLILALIIYSIYRLFNRIKRRIEAGKGTRLHGFRFRNYEILDTDRQTSVLFSILDILKWILILILVYAALTILFSIFPWTGNLSGKLVSYLLEPLKKIMLSLWNYLPNLFTIAVVVVFFRYFLRLLAYFKTEIEKGKLNIPGFYKDWANPTFQILRVLVLAFMLIVIFPYLPGSDSGIFKGVSVFLGVLFTFGSAGALGNVVAGLVLTYMRAYRIGDRVKIGEAVGDVLEKTLLVTKIRTTKNEIISIPNSAVMNSQTINYSVDSSNHGLILHTSVTIGYDSPWRTIHELLIKAALATDLIEKDPAPFVFQEKLDDFYVVYQINAFTKSPNQQHIIYSYLHQHIQDAFNEAGVEIMSSHYSNIRDGNKSTVPADHLPKDYVAPSFRVSESER